MSGSTNQLADRCPGGGGQIETWTPNKDIFPTLVEYSHRIWEPRQTLSGNTVDNTIDKKTARW